MERFSDNVVAFLTQLLVTENWVWGMKMVAVWMCHI